MLNGEAALTAFGTEYKNFNSIIHSNKKLGQNLGIHCNHLVDHHTSLKHCLMNFHGKVHSTQREKLICKMLHEIFQLCLNTYLRGKKTRKVFIKFSAVNTAAQQNHGKCLKAFLFVLFILCGACTIFVSRKKK